MKAALLLPASVFFAGLASGLSDSHRRRDGARRAPAQETTVDYQPPACVTTCEQSIFSHSPDCEEDSTITTIAINSSSTADIITSTATATISSSSTSTATATTNAAALKTSGLVNATVAANVTASLSTATCCKAAMPRAVVLCIQASCPTLHDLISWQNHRATVCRIQPRDENVLQIGVSIFLFTLASLSVAARFLSRAKCMSGPGFWWDDWSVLFLWVLSLEICVCLPILHFYGLGRDVFGGATSHDIQILLLWFQISISFYLIDTYGTKVAIILFYLRIWEGNTGYRRVCWVTAAVLFAVIIAFSVGSATVFWPLKYYDGHSAVVRQTHGGIQIFDTIISIAVLNIAMDFWVLFLPISRLTKMTGVSRKRRISIAGIFLLGLIVTTTSLVRIKYIIPLQNSTNPTWDFGRFGFWSKIELHLSMIGCNLPTMAGLIHRLRTRWRNKGRVSRAVSSAQLQSMETETTSSMAKDDNAANERPMVRDITTRTSTQVQPGLNTDVEKHDSHISQPTSWHAPEQANGG